MEVQDFSRRFVLGQVDILERRLDDWRAIRARDAATCEDMGSPAFGLAVIAEHDEGIQDLESRIQSGREVLAVSYLS